MKERPILLKAREVRAVLDGRQSRFRRVVKPQPSEELLSAYDRINSSYCINRTHADYLTTCMKCPYGQPGTLLWVRETWQYYDWTEEGEPCVRFHADNARTWPEPGNEAWSDKLVDVFESLSRDENYSIDNRARDRRWRPSIHMPRWASRITLEITDVRVERLQDISEADALAEGVTAGKYRGLERANARTYSDLWESINGPGSWESNPWVWVVEFRRIMP